MATKKLNKSQQYNSPMNKNIYFKYYLESLNISRNSISNKHTSQENQAEIEEENHC